MLWITTGRLQYFLLNAKYLFLKLCVLEVKDADFECETQLRLINETEWHRYGPKSLAVIDNSWLELRKFLVRHRCLDLMRLLLGGIVIAVGGVGRFHAKQTLVLV